MMKALWKRLRNLTETEKPLEPSVLSEHEIEERRRFEEEMEQIRETYQHQTNQLNALLAKTEYERRRQQLDRELQRRKEVENG